MSSSSSSSSSLSSSTLKDLLKICRSHNFLLPDPLPSDKGFYIDLINRHRQMMSTSSGGEVYEQQDIAMDKEGQTTTTAAAAAAAAARSQREVAASAAAGQRYAQQQQGGEGVADESPDLSFSKVSTRLRRAAPPPPSAAASAASSALPAALSIPAVAADVSSGSSSSSFAASAAEQPLISIPGVSPDPVYDEEGEGGEGGGGGGGGDGDGDDDDGGEEEFIRSPAVQKITQVLQNIAAFDYLERHTGVARFYWLALIVSVLSIGLFLYVGVLAVCHFVCFIYPAFQTFKTLEGKYLPLLEDASASAAAAVVSPAPGEAAPAASAAAAAAPSSRRSRRSLSFHSPLTAALSSDKSIEIHSYWLTYWCVFGLFRLVEFASDFLVHHLSSTRGNGFYYEPLKILFLVWCFHPSSQGCAWVYRWIISPLFLPREAIIDAAIARATEGTAQAAREVKAIILKKVAKRIAGTNNSEDTPQKEKERTHRRGESGSLKKLR